MEISKLHLVDKSRLVEIRGQLYVKTNERKGLVPPESFVPVYFAAIETSIILHDTPVMGAMAAGNGTRRVVWPLFIN